MKTKHNGFQPNTKSVTTKHIVNQGEGASSEKRTKETSQVIKTLPPNHNELHKCLWHFTKPMSYTDTKHCLASTVHYNTTDRWETILQLTYVWMDRGRKIKERFYLTAVSMSGLTNTTKLQQQKSRILSMKTSYQRHYLHKM